MGEAILIVSGIEQALADPAKAAAMATGMGFDLSKLPPGMDIYTVLGQVPAEQAFPTDQPVHCEVCHHERQHDRPGSRQADPRRVYRPRYGYA